MPHITKQPKAKKRHLRISLDVTEAMHIWIVAQAEQQEMTQVQLLRSIIREQMQKEARHAD